MVCINLGELERILKEEDINRLTSVLGDDAISMALLYKYILDSKGENIMTKKRGNSTKGTENIENVVVGVVAGKAGKRAINRAIKGIHSFETAADGLSSLNTMRGGAKGFKGFVAEEMEAAEASSLGRSTVVLNDNGIADLAHKKVNGSTALKQMKVGYKPVQIDFAKYKGETIIVDKGNPNFNSLKKQGAKYGIKVVEAHVSGGESKLVADAMQLETKITGSRNAVITPKLYQGMKTVSAAHSAGISAAKAGAVFGGGFSIGSNIMQCMKGNKTVGEAAGAVVVDTMVSGATSYGVGAGGSLIGSTPVGAAAIETAEAAGAAITSAPGIGAVVSAGSTATSAIARAGTALASGAAGLATGAVSSAAAGASSLASGTILAGTVNSIGGTAVATTAAFGALGVTVAPLAFAGALLGVVCSLFSDD